MADNRDNSAGHDESGGGAGGVTVTNRAGTCTAWPVAWCFGAELRRLCEFGDGRVVFAVAGAGGVVSWEASRDWSPGRGESARFGEIKVHARRPYDGVMWITDRGVCEWLGPVCFYDGGFLAGERLGEAWIRAGGDPSAVWPVLERWYRERLDRPGTGAGT